MHVNGNGLGCAACATKGVGCLGCPYGYPPGEGLGMAPASARYSSDPDAAGLGALPGPSLLDEIQAAAQAVVGQFLILERELLDDQQKLLNAEAAAQRKNQGALLTEANNAYRASINLLAKYRDTKARLLNVVQQIATMQTDYAAKRISLVSVIVTSIALASSTPFTINTARQLLVDIPRFTQQTAGLIERVNAATTLTPSQPVSLTQAFGLQNLTQLAPWIVGGLALIYVVPRLLPEKRRA